MAKAHKIKRIIHSTKKTSVITQAMQLVSASKLPKALKRLDATRPFSDLVAQMVESYAALSLHPYFQPRNTAKKKGLIVIGTDRGLCGSLNLHLFKSVLGFIQEHQASGHSLCFSAAGQKSVQFLSKHTDLLSSVTQLGDKPELSQLMGLITPMLKAYDNKEIDSIHIACNSFENTLTQTAKIHQILPRPLPKHTTSTDYIYEPNKDDVIDTLLRHYIEATIYRLIVENVACEQAARMLAMKNATDNANELISDLNLTYNKIRQALITQEIAEISAGANQSDGETL